MAETHASYRKQSREGHTDRLRRIEGGADLEQDKALVRHAIAEHEAHDHHGAKPTKIKLKDGGSVEGKAPKRRLDRASGGRAGKGKAHTNVNVIVAPGHAGPPGPMPAMAPPIPMPPPGAAAMPPRPPMPMPPPGAMGPPPGLGGPPPGMPPGVMMPHKRGGRVGRKEGGKVDHPDMEAGAGGGLGRLEKVREYGANADKGAGRKRGGAC